jgi:hypothetical protein
VANSYIRGTINIGTVWDWDDPGTVFKAMLVTATYVYSASHNTRSQITNEITNGGYTTGGLVLAGRSAVQGGAGSRYDADTLTFPSLAVGDLPAAAVIYRDTGSSSTDDLVCYCALSATPAPDGNDYRVVWSASAGVFSVNN